MGRYEDIYELRAEITAGLLADIHDLKELVKLIEGYTEMRNDRAAKEYIRVAIETNRDKMQLY